MPRSTDTRSERIELRARPEVKAVIERAAHLRHTTVSAYLLETAYERAQGDLKETETVVLNDNDRNRFFALLSSAPRPNKALKSLFREPRK